MNKIVIILLSAFVCLPCASKSKELKLKVGSYNVCTSDSRRKKIKQGKFITDQRFYCNSADALGKMIASLDCDVIGLQEICDSIWGVKGNIGLRDKVAAARGDDKYKWILFPNTQKGKISYDDAIGYDSSRLKLLESGIFWLTEREDKAWRPEGAPKGSNRPLVWGRFKDKTTGISFAFYCTHLVLGSMHKDGGTEYNATHLIRIINEYFKEKEPSIIVGDFNASEKSKAFKIICSSRWKDSYLTLMEKGEGVLTPNIGTQPSPDESKLNKGRIDHIMFDKFEPLTFSIDTRRLPTADNTLHYPSDHLPIVAELRYSRK